MIKIVGDINFSDGFFDTGFGIGSSIKKGDDPFKYLERRKEDYWIGNFECVASNISNKKGIYKNQFRISPKDLEHIKHLDLYNVANNHVMQHSGEAYLDFCNYLKNNDCQIMGSLETKTNNFIHKNKHIGILAFSQREEKYSKSPLYWYNPEYIEIEQEFKNIKNCDFKIAYVHWGNEFINRPYADQVFLGHYLIDLGFDLVIGLHPHVLQGFEIYKGKHIFYSIGNFVFNMPTDATRFSTIVNVDIIENEWCVDYEYVKINEENFPVVIDNSMMPNEFTFEYLNSKIYPLQENELYYKELFGNMKTYRSENIKTLFKNLGRFKSKDLFDIIKDFYKRRF